jgi:tRNA threonylcarbamoyl adenosine modification protein (Sua5/YciO/YrdC/YwlC family)
MRRLSVLELDEAVALLAAGELLAIPTDTVYGIAARLDHPEAVRRLFSAKRRPESLALPVLAADLGQLEALIGPLEPDLGSLAEAFWPGALTVVVACGEALAELIGSGDATVGLRIPDDELALALLERSGPLAVSSANLHGQPPCTSAQEVLAQLTDQGSVTAVLDGGQRDGLPSSVVRLSDGELTELRPGPLSLEQLRQVLDPR